jgi:hypothetical protein
MVSNGRTRPSSSGGLCSPEIDLRGEGLDWDVKSESRVLYLADERNV